MHAAKLFEIAANEAQQMFGHGNNIVVSMLTYAWTPFPWRKDPPLVIYSYGRIPSSDPASFDKEIGSINPQQRGNMS